MVWSLLCYGNTLFFNNEHRGCPHSLIDEKLVGTCFEDYYCSNAFHMRDQKVFQVVLESPIWEILKTIWRQFNREVITKRALGNWVRFQMRNTWMRNFRCVTVLLIISNNWAFVFVSRHTDSQFLHLWLILRFFFLPNYLLWIVQSNNIASSARPN